MGYAAAPTTRNVLAQHGIRVAGSRWRWAPGLKGGTFPPHRHINGEIRSDEGDWEALPGEDVNGDSCACNVVPAYRTADGRLAKPGLAPVFQPPTFPVTAGFDMSRDQFVFDWGPLSDFMAQLTEQPREFTLNVPDGAFVVNVPESHPTFHVAAPNVTVEAAPTPEVTVQPTFAVESPTMNVQPATVNVAAPKVTVQPQITVKPAPVKIIREKVAKAVRFRRNNSGQIEEATVVEE